jgi:hypothetical protein
LGRKRKGRSGVSHGGRGSGGEEIDNDSAPVVDGGEAPRGAKE